jgi:hypothetical protein
MKLDPGMHIVMHLVFFGKTGVTLGRIWGLHGGSSVSVGWTPDQGGGGDDDGWRRGGCWSARHACGGHLRDAGFGSDGGATSSRLSAGGGAWGPLVLAGLSGGASVTPQIFN